MTKSEVFDQYERVLAQFERHMPWLYEQLEWHTNNGGGYVGGVKLPGTLFDGFTDPRRGFVELAADVSKTAMLVVGKIRIEKDISVTLGRLQVLLSRIESTVRQLREVEEFFQPDLLARVCDWATQNDRKRKYRAGLMSIVCARDKGEISVRVPRNYMIPDIGPIAAFRSAVSSLAPQ